MDRPHPIIQMLSWRTRTLTPSQLEMVLMVLAVMGMQPFTLTQIVEMLPPEISSDKKKRRSVSNLLQALASIGYLSKPSERKWVKNSATLSHFLSSLLIELSEIEKRELPRYKDERVIKVGSQVLRDSRKKK